MEDKDSKNLQDIKDWKQQVSWALSHYFEFINKNGIVHVRLQLWLWISESVSSVTQSCPTLCEPVDSRSRLPCPSLTPRTYWNSCPSHWWCHPTLILCHSLLFLPSIFSSIRIFSNELILHIRWPKYWSFSFSISPSNEHPWLISLRMNWLDLLAVQGTLKSLLQHHSSKVSILHCSAFFIVQLSYPYMTYIALTR